MATKRRAIIAVIICTFFMAAGSTLFKIAVDSSPTHITGILTHLPFYYALLIYGMGAVLLIWGLRHGELSLLYPIIGLNFVWVAFTSKYIIGEPMNLFKWAGTIMILFGVAFMGQDSIRKRWKHLSGQ